MRDRKNKHITSTKKRFIIILLVCVAVLADVGRYSLRCGKGIFTKRNRTPTSILIVSKLVSGYGRIFFNALVRRSSRISERLRFRPYVLVVFRASILPGPGVKEQTSIYPKER